MLAKVVDGLSQRILDPTSPLSPAAIDEGKRLISEIGRIRYELQRDKPISLLAKDQDVDTEIWNEYLESFFITGKASWFKLPWLVSECYAYRLLHGHFSTSQNWKLFDPFRHQKQESLVLSKGAILATIPLIQSLLTTPPAANWTWFHQLTSLSLWGNRTDLSLLVNLKAEDLAARQEKQVSEEFIVVDERRAIWEEVLSGQSPEARIDLVLDNAGFELWADLILAEWLISSGIAKTVVLHGKRVPWFVSDVLYSDLEDLFSHIEANYELGPFIIARIRSRLATGAFRYEADAFWTTPFAYHHLAELAPQLWQQFKKSDFVIFKGDLNYRKLVFDCSWPCDTPFQQAIGPTWNRSDAPPGMILRTCKADVVVGVAQSLAAKLNEQDPDWQVNGNWAVIQGWFKRNVY